MAKLEPINYDMILIWNTLKRPFVSQKLRFKASPKFAQAFQTAQELTESLQKAGGLPKKSVKLVAVAVHGALEEWQDENAPFIKRQKKELSEKVKSIISKASTKPKDSVKNVIKPKKSKKEITFTLDTQSTGKKQPKAKIAEPIEVMYDARKKAQNLDSEKEPKGKDQRKANQKLKASIKASQTKAERKAARADKTVAKGFSRQTLSGRKKPSLRKKA